MKCIYCKTEDRGLFKAREHVIPRSFGTFGSKTPTLRCVCDECNSYFMKELDQGLARDTLEGITRYRKGILSREQRFPKSVQFALDDSEENGEFAGAILGGYDPLTGNPLPVVPQFWIRNIKTNEWERYRIEQIKDVTINEEIHGSTTPGSREMRIIAPSKDLYYSVMEELKKYGIPYREKEKLETPPFLKGADPEGKITISGTIHGTIDKKKRRALVKLLFNFAAYYLGDTEMLKGEWDAARDFVRNDGEGLKGRATNEPFWNGQETEELRFADDGYNLRIENKNGNVLGVIQLYNLFTYEFILVENYSIPPEKEIACRFNPNEEPIIGFKMSLPQ